MQEIFRRAHNNKRQYFIEPFQCELQMRSCLTMVSVQFARFIAFNHRCRNFFVWQRRQLCVKISNWSRFYIDSGTQHQNKIIILSFLCSWICAVFNWLPPAFTLYCLQLALWCNCDIKNARKCMKFAHWQSFMCTFCLIVLKLDWGYS